MNLGNTWLYGYGDETGLLILKEDPETLAVELFYDPVVKKELTDEKKKELWSLVNRSAREKEKNGIVFKTYMPDQHIDELKGLMTTNPRKALSFIQEMSIHVDLGTHGTTLKVAHEKWRKLIGEIVNSETA